MYLCYPWNNCFCSASYVTYLTHIILCLAGFGNLRGNMEMWDVTGNRRLISNPQAPDTTEFEWSPDGVHFITATTTPRLRIGNG